MDLPILEYLNNPAGMAVFTTLATGWLINLFKIEKRSFFGIIKLRQLIALVVGAGLVIGTHFVGIGFAVEYTAFNLYGWAIGVGVTASGIANIEIWKSIMEKVGAVNKQAK